MCLCSSLESHNHTDFDHSLKLFLTSTNRLTFSQVKKIENAARLKQKKKTKVLYKTKYDKRVKLFIGRGTSRTNA